jgi:hypothetical protein
MIFYRTPDGFFHRTQAEAGKVFEKLNIDTSQPGLVDYFNQLVREGSVPDRENEPLEAASQDLNVPDRENVDVVALQAELARLRNLTVELKPKPTINQVEEKILDLEGNEFARVLEATLSRLGELRKAGFDGLRKLAARHTSRSALELGLGYLLLEETKS